ncbi:hypothetical protein [Escherichia coli]|uniref:hypothetical protein n=1 Tax=Escherichia coli TaxID=562 RepID=UPI002FCD4A67
MDAFTPEQLAVLKADPHADCGGGAIKRPARTTRPGGMNWPPQLDAARQKVSELTAQLEEEPGRSGN